VRVRDDPPSGPARTKRNYSHFTVELRRFRNVERMRVRREGWAVNESVCARRSRPGLAFSASQRMLARDRVISLTSATLTSCSLCIDSAFTVCEGRSAEGWRRAVRWERLLLVKPSASTTPTMITGCASYGQSSTADAGAFFSREFGQGPLGDRPLTITYPLNARRRCHYKSHRRSSPLPRTARIAGGSSCSPGSGAWTGGGRP
jgi:hypothetical protein